jgi:hypothetical protein
VADILINPEAKQRVIVHNKEAVRARYNYLNLKNKFEQLLAQLYKLDLGG